jgi:hypothetical protein
MRVGAYRRCHAAGVDRLHDRVIGIGIGIGIGVI